MTYTMPQLKPDTHFVAQLHETPFCVAEYRESLASLSNTGAIVEFSGHVRQSGDLSEVVALEIDHYPPLTHPALQHLIERASARWSLNGLYLFHRVGHVPLGDLIVWVGTASAHRADAFAAASFVMDKLKTDVPFWKKEISANGVDQWVKQKSQDRTKSAAHDAPSTRVPPHHALTDPNIAC